MFRLLRGSAMSPLLHTRETSALRQNLLPHILPEHVALPLSELVLYIYSMPLSAFLVVQLADRKHYEASHRHEINDGTDGGTTQLEDMKDPSHVKVKIQMQKGS